jgi:hypothetical protein
MASKGGPTIAHFIVLAVGTVLGPVVSAQVSIFLREPVYKVRLLVRA